MINLRSGLIWFCFLAGFLIFAGCGDDKGTESQPPPQNDLDQYIQVPSSDLVGMLADPSRPRVYIADNGQYQVHVLNTQTYQIENSIDLGHKLTFMEISTDYSLLFVAFIPDTLVGVIDLDSLKALSPIEAPGTPTGITMGANAKLYVSCTDVHPPITPITIHDVSSFPISIIGTAGMSDPGIYICGGRNDYSGLYTYDIASGVGVAQWDISGDSCIKMQNADIATSPIKTISCPSDSRIFLTWFGPGFGINPQFDDGYLPVHRSSDLEKIGQLKVDYSPIAVAISHSGDTAYVAHSDGVWNPTYQDRHDRDRKDLHIFNTRNYTELGHYILPQYVDLHGIELGPDGRVYLLLGDENYTHSHSNVTATAIGVIEP